MTGLLIALCGATGVYLVFTSAAFGWKGFRNGDRVGGMLDRVPHTRRFAGVRTARRRTNQVIAAGVALGLVGALFGFAVFGSVFPALAIGGFVAAAPAASVRVRRARAMAEAQDAWPRLIEEIRVLAGAAGRPLPQAVVEAGRRGPVELQPAFEKASREWLLSTDFERTLAVLKTELADPTADATCETLLIAHELGGSDIDGRLAALAADRLADTQGRKDARAKQAGARFARLFVLIVPAGMAMAGLQMGTGRAAYQSAFGQAAVLVGLVVVVACWIWAGVIMALPNEDRVFASIPSRDAGQ